jgi:hypothetical protein
MARSRRSDIAVSRKASRRLEAAASKYPFGIDGYVSRSARRYLFMSRRYSFSRVCAPYYGCPWKCTKRLRFFFFTNESTPPSAD